MDKKVAVPINEDGVLESHFGQTRLFAIYTIKDNKVETKENMTPPPHAPGVLPKWLATNDVTDVLVNSMGERASKILAHFNVNVMLGAPVIAADELVNGFLNNTIEFTNELCLHDHHHHHHHNHEHGHKHHHKHEHQHKHEHGHNRHSSTTPERE
jgi:predicted Fe-Mo cluster-binding NifX family protein